jgi:uncharacterized protein
MAESNFTDPFHILSLDGGGIKGLFSAAVLAALEEDLNINIIDHFDLIAGTSTGGIIALGLGLGIRPRDIVDFYISKGPIIFKQWYGFKSFQHWVFRKFSQKQLILGLQDCFKNKCLGHSKKRLVIPSYNLGEDDVYLFKTPHLVKYRRDYKEAVWKIALATSAAPTFFPSCRDVGMTRLIDGGVWANNPTMVAIVEAAGGLKVPLNAIRILNIGTSEEINHRRWYLNSGGKLSWAVGNDAIEIIMRGQSIAAFKQAEILLGTENIDRLNPKVGSNEFTLDGIGKTDDLIGKAAHYSRGFLPIFERKFLSHKSSQYTPCYTLGNSE